MELNDYQRLALRTLNPALSRKDVLINGVMGLCGEAGEAIDLVKKHLAQGHELDREGLIRELGDVAWYLAETAYALDVTLDEVCGKNIDKLRRRYPEGFSATDSIARVDEAREAPAAAPETSATAVDEARDAPAAEACAAQGPASR